MRKRLPLPYGETEAHQQRGIQETAGLGAKETSTHSRRKRHLGSNPTRFRTMYRKEKSIQMKSSASALYNNLSVLPISDKSLTYFTVVHGNTVNMVSASADCLNFSHRQLQSKEGSVAVSSSLITQ
ncbi:WD repeat-containing protein 54-like, partial [Ascaphus truei]|uniref:WD repeat-containing protein 54-like n=1 Tax=Ascaphus truei TaxID=8439 RepID=UPI003F59DA1B